MWESRERVGEWELEEARGAQGAGAAWASYVQFQQSRLSSTYDCRGFFSGIILVAFFFAL